MIFREVPVLFSVNLRDRKANGRGNLLAGDMGRVSRHDPEADFARRKGGRAFLTGSATAGAGDKWCGGL